MGGKESQSHNEILIKQMSPERQAVTNVMTEGDDYVLLKGRGHVGPFVVTPYFPHIKTSCLGLEPSAFH